MTRAYGEIFLDDAMDNLGSAVEHAVLFCHVNGQEFLDLFVASGIADDFQRGNITYISGMSGIELARKILQQCDRKISGVAEITFCSYPPEYWVGWILAYYQWYTQIPFSVICRSLRYDTMMNLYGVLHEADPRKAVEIFDTVMEKAGESHVTAHAGTEP